MQMINDEKFNWNLSDIFKSEEEFENSKNKLSKSILIITLMMYTPTILYPTKRL